MKNIYVTLFFLVACSPTQILSIKNKKKSLKTTTESPEQNDPQPAIIAIEIVDPNENSTTSKNSKRTIESALGYGYNSYDTSKPRYEVYKYSQHDIPPFKGDSPKYYNGLQHGPINIQKSVRYTLPTITEHVQNRNNILKPGTTLYSSLSAKGQVGDLRSSLSQISGLEHNQAPVPVVVLRIYPDQLKDSSIQANLPESHPFAKSINSLNIQSLLLHYIKALQNPLTVNQYSGPQQNSYPSSNQVYSAPPQLDTHQPANNKYNGYQLENYYTQDTYRKPSGESPQQYQYYQQSYPQKSGYENNQYQQQPEQQYSDYGNGVQVQNAPVKYQFRYQTTGAPPKQHLKTPVSEQKQQYYYVQPGAQSSYSTEPEQYYETAQQQDYGKQEQSKIQQYYTDNHQGYYQEEEVQQYVPKSQKLLTTENYPTDKHTRVIFRTKTGNVRTPEQEADNAKEVKTIKIHVPENIAKVEVQESERPYYNNYQQAYPEGADQSTDPYEEEQEYSKQNAPDNYYSVQDAVQQDFYNTGDRPSEDSQFNYQNIDYDQMVKYFNKRGTMPRYFFQTPEAWAGGDQKTLSTEEMVAAYEEVAFPSTTMSPEKKKVKSKKRT